MKRKLKDSLAGFTLVEVTLALLFISMLLLAIAMLSLHITSTYQKGLAIKAVSANGRILIDDLVRAISASPNKDIRSDCRFFDEQEAQEACIKDGGRKLIFQQQFEVATVNKQKKNVPINGVFCTGRYSYIWNTGYVLNENYGASHKKAKLNGDDNFRLLKFEDGARELCKAHLDRNKYRYNGNDREYKVDVKMISERKELLANFEDDLALYDFEILQPTQHDVTLHSFYSGTFILATVKGVIDITGAGDYCKDPPGGLSTDFNYCAINKFNFAMRATGELKKDE